MIRNSAHAYYLIRTVIFFLHYLVPACLLYTACAIASYGFQEATRFRIPLFVEAYAAAESLFYICGYLPYRIYLQREAVHPPILDRAGRRALFDKCHYNVPDAKAYFRKWFLGARLEDIKRDNLKEFFLWAFFNRAGEPGENDEELEEYIAITEEVLGRKIEPGRGPAKCLRLTLDKVDMLHRSLVWYSVVGLVDQVAFFKLSHAGFKWHRSSLSSFFTVFPFRPQTLFARHKSPTKNLTYWIRDHTSKTRLPIVFIHGLGIGLWSYTEYFQHLMGPEDGIFSTDPDDQVGILLLEFLPISFRITHPMPTKDEMCTEIASILKHHGWSKVVLAAHSYGSIISAHLIKSPLTAHMIGPTLLIDPIPVMLHLPDVAYNFTRRKPQSASEHQLYYFASMDVSVSHTLGRHFFWAENILWLDDIKGRDITFSLAGRDLIVNTTAVGRYLATGNPAGNVKSTADNTTVEVDEHADDDLLLSKQLNGPSAEPSSTTDDIEVKGRDRVDDSAEAWKHRPWKGHGIDILWYETIDHASVFDEYINRRPLVRVLKTYCEQGAKES